MTSIKALISSVVVAALLLLSAGVVSASALTAKSGGGGGTVSTIEQDVTTMTKDYNAIVQAVKAGAARELIAAAAMKAACASGSSTALCAAAAAKVIANAKALGLASSAGQRAAAFYREAKPLGSMARLSVNRNKLRPWALEFTTWLNGEAKDQRIIQTAVLAVRG